LPRRRRHRPSTRPANSTCPQGRLQPVDSAGYSPIESAPTQPRYDAQRSAATPTTCRGKVPADQGQRHGKYSIPAGNMFRRRDRQHPARNLRHGLPQPLRLSVDKRPASSTSATTGRTRLGRRQPGPVRSGRVDRITGPGFYGWPYCTARTHHRDVQRVELRHHATGPKYNSPAPDEQLLRNTGLTRCRRPSPPGSATPATPVPGGFGSGSESPMAARSTATTPQTRRPEVPRQPGRQYFAGEFGRAGSSHRGQRGRLAGTIDNFPWNGKQVMACSSARTGRCTSWTTARLLQRRRQLPLYRYDYVAPAATARRRRSPAPTRRAGAAPLAVTSRRRAPSDPEGGALTYRGRFGDGGTSTVPTRRTRTPPTAIRRTLTVRDPRGAPGRPACRSASATTAPRSPSTPPLPASWLTSREVPWSVTVTDPEERHHRLPPR